MSTTYGLNPDNFCKGAGNVCINGTPVGMLRQGSRITLTPVSSDADVDIRCAQAGGDLLGRIQGGTIYRLSFEVVETQLQNVRRAFDLSGALAGDKIPWGRSNAKATEFQLIFYGIGPYLKTRRWGAHKAIMDRAPETVIGAEGEVNSLNMSCLICRDLTYADDYCYGLIQDYVA